MSDEIKVALSKFVELDRPKQECSSYDIFVLQQALFDKGYGGFDLIGALPIEISIKIFEQLTAKDLCACGEVSKKWRSVTQDSSIWKKKCIEMYYGDERRLYVSKGKLLEKYGWEKVYQQLYRIENNLRNGRAKSFRLLKGHRERINDAKLKENILVTGSADRTVRIWNVETGECINALSGNSFSSTGELLRELRGHVTAVRCISISKNYVASCAFDGSLIVWNWRTVFDFNSRKGLMYPKSQDTIDIDKEVVRTLNIDDNQVIIGYLSGKIGILGFDDYNYDH
ncbi:18726_t:CDS:2 [Entrophospora sp. SA101]|nr:18726_t:CDS:2 [Entrophospora sp. SA101]